MNIHQINKISPTAYPNMQMAYMDIKDEDKRRNRKKKTSLKDESGFGEELKVSIQNIQSKENHNKK